MTKRFEVQGFSRYWLETEDETNIESYQMVNKETGKTKTKNKMGFWTSLVRDDGHHFTCSSRMFIWNNAPYFIDLKNKIESSYTPVFGWEDDYCINLKSKEIKIWSKKGNYHLTPNGDQYQYIGVSFCKNGKMYPYSVARIVWETIHHQQLDTTKDEIRHLDFDFKNNNESNLMKLPINVNSKIKCIYSYATNRNPKNNTNWKVDDLFNMIDNFNIPDWKKERIQKEILKLI